LGLIRLGGVELELRPSGAARSAAALFVADLHLGKESAFRRLGLPIPEGATEDSLARLEQEIRACGTETLALLGDLYHAESVVDERLLDRLSAWRFRLPRLRIIFVRGNHDRGAQHLPGLLAMEEWPEGKEWMGIALRHHPAAAGPGLAGHLHPSVRLTAGGESRSVACYWLHQEELVLPAWGGFTGRSRIVPERDDRIWVLAGARVIEAPALACRG
jgi:DNA ligase-associated metallophosphoesterase